MKNIIVSSEFAIIIIFLYVFVILKKVHIKDDQ